MPAADMIAAREIDRFVADFRNCRDRGLASNCTEYARDRLISRNPTESTVSINSVVNHGYNAVIQGGFAQRYGNDRVAGTHGGQDPADTQYGAGQRGPIQYRYGTSVTVQVTSGPRAGEVFPMRVVVTNSSALTAGEIRAAALQEAERIARDYLGGSPGMRDSDYQITADVVIESSYRQRV